MEFKSRMEVGKMAANENVLSSRYATPKMNKVFSEEGKIVAERELWIAVAETQRELGVDIPEEQINKFRHARDRVDTKRIKEIERVTRHDVKAGIEAFVEEADAEEIIHKAMTARDLTDNVEQMQNRKAGEIIFGKYVSVLRHVLDKAKEYSNIVLTGRSHHQPAQATLLGRRFSMWGEELMVHLMGFRFFLDCYPLRGIKGPMGTQLDQLTLLGSPEKVDALERKVAEKLGFKNILQSTGQVYPRSLDYALLSHLSLLACSCENLTKTMRLMAGAELVTEGFQDGQVGSSAMPHKMNTRTSERVGSLSSLLKAYVDGASRIGGDQWEEGDVSCSAIRRVILADAFYTSDGLCEAVLTVLNEMGAYPVVIEKEVDRYLPFLATTEILNMAMKKGIGREEAHEVIKKHAVSVARKMRESGAEKNDLAIHLSADPIFCEKGITLADITAILLSRSKFIGNAERQIKAVVQQAEGLFHLFPEAAAYEPQPIL